MILDLLYPHLITDTDLANNNPAIAMSYMGKPSNFQGPIPGYGTPIQSYEGGYVTPGNKHRGFCIGDTQFRNIIAGAQGKQPQHNFSSNIMNYKLLSALVGPEQNVTHGKGRIGMNISGLWVYLRK